MVPNTRVLNTIFGPYRTSQAIQRAEFADFIPVPISKTNINAVHPIPIYWLEDELLPRERDQVREHVMSILSNSNGLPNAFIAAVNNTLNNLDDIRDGHGSRRQGTTTRPSTTDIRGVRFGNIDDITRDVADMTMGNIRSMRSPSPRPQGILRNTSQPLSSSSSPTSNVRQPSPNRDALVAIEVHLNEVESRINRRYDGELTADALRRCRESIASTRAHISHARTFQHLTSDDIELARIMVDSVCSIADAPPASRRRRQPARTAPVDAWDRFARQARRGIRQDQLRECAHGRRQIPLFRSDPVEPQVGDGLLLPDDEVLILAPNFRWLRYHHPYVGVGGVYLLEDEE